jgi:hypothetical protein
MAMASTSAMQPTTGICDAKDELDFVSQTKVEFGSQKAFNVEVHM